MSIDTYLLKIEKFLLSNESIEDSECSLDLKVLLHYTQFAILDTVHTILCTLQHIVFILNMLVYRTYN